MTRNLEQILDALPTERRAAVEHRAAELATLKDLRQAMQKTQVDLAAALHIGQDSISRLEKRSDMLLSTLRGYIEAMGGKLEIVARFPNRPPVTIEHLADTCR
jgi:DNA-binding XRE family transcriptional regulator